MATLYVTEPGAYVEKEYDRIIITLQDEVLESIPIRKLEAIVLFGNIGITTPAINLLLLNGVNLHYLSRSGKILGALQSFMKPGSQFFPKQYELLQSESFRVSFSKQIVCGKLSNYEVYLRRLIRNRSGLLDDLEQKEATRIMRSPDLMDEIKEKVIRAETIDEVLGLEGYGSKEYFNVYFNAFSSKSEMRIRKRQRRPPKDPVNALLSLGYTLLSQTVLSAIIISKLDPFLGFFHTNKPGRPSLALDLMEEFRPIIVDSLVLTLVNKGIIKQEDFTRDQNGAMRLGKTGFKVFILQYQKRIDTQTKNMNIGKEMSYRKIFECQAQSLRNIIEGSESVYVPYQWK